MKGRKLKAGQIVGVVNREWPERTKRFVASALLLESGRSLTKVVVRAVLTENEAAYPERARTAWEIRVVGNDDIIALSDAMLQQRFRKLCETYGKPDVRKDANGRHRLHQPPAGSKQRLGAIPTGAFYTTAPEQAPNESEQEYAERLLRMGNTKGRVCPAGVRRVFIGAIGRGVSRRYALLQALDIECARCQPGVMGVQERWTKPDTDIDHFDQEQLKAAYFAAQPQFRAQVVAYGAHIPTLAKLADDGFFDSPKARRQSWDTRRRPRRATGPSQRATTRGGQDWR